MPQPPPRKVKPSAQLKTLHSEQVSKLQAKHQQECDLLEDIRTFTRQRSVIEKEYAQAMLKLTGQLLKRDFQAMPDLSSEDGKEHRTAMAVWRVILEETDILAKKRLQAADMYLEKIAEPVKPLKSNKQQCMKKVLPQLNTMQTEVSQTVSEMCKTQKTYNVDETQAYDARSKAKEAEEKLNRKSKGIFQSIASLQKNYSKLKSRMEVCESKSTESRNEYLLCMSAANAHHERYFTTDLPHLMEVLDGEIFERIQEYFAIYGNTAQEISCYENRSCNRIVEQTAMINRDFDLKCFLYSNHLFTDLVQYEFEPCLQDKCNKISKDNNSAHQLDKEARKWATKIAKENKAIKEYQKSLKAIGNGDKVSETGSTEAVSQDPETKSEELLRNIRQAETARAKAEARIEALRQGDVNVDEWLSSANVDSLGLDDDLDLPRTPSRTSIKTDSSGHTEDQEPTYTNYDEDDDFLDETFDVQVGDFSLKSGSSQYPMKCRSIYEFHAGNPDELDMQENEELEIIANGDGDGWVRAKNTKGLIGLIPENYIMFIDDGDNVSAVSARTTSVSGSVSVTDSMDNQTVTEVDIRSRSSVDESDVGSPPAPVTPTSITSIPIIEEPEVFPPPPPMSPDAQEVTSYSQEVTSYSQEVTSYSSGDIEVQQATNSMENMNLPLGEGTWVRALYDYEGTTEDELSFVEGTIIRILRKDENGIDDGFWEGETNGRVGVFPSLVVEEMTAEGSGCQEFPSPLQSPPDHIPPPPVMIIAATPENELPPMSPLTPTTPVTPATPVTPEQATPVANGTDCEVVEDVTPTSEQYRRRVRHGTNYRNSCHSDPFYNQSPVILNKYDARFDDDCEESIV